MPALFLLEVYCGWYQRLLYLSINKGDVEAIFRTRGPGRMCRSMLVHDFQSKESMFGVPRICSLPGRHTQPPRAHEHHPEPFVAVCCFFLHISEKRGEDIKIHLRGNPWRRKWKQRQRQRLRRRRRQRRNQRRPQQRRSNPRIVRPYLRPGLGAEPFFSQTALCSRASLQKVLYSCMSPGGSPTGFPGSG